MKNNSTKFWLLLVLLSSVAVLTAQTPSASKQSITDNDKLQIRNLQVKVLQTVNQITMLQQQLNQMQQQLTTLSQNALKDAKIDTTKYDLNENTLEVFAKPGGAAVAAGGPAKK